MKSISAITGKVKWKKPKRDSEHGEIFTQLTLASEKPKIDKLPSDIKHIMQKLQDGDIYDHAIKHGKVKKLTPDDCKEVENHTYDDGAWEHLHPEKKKNVLKHFRDGKVEMPIVLKNKENGKRWLLAGNTRMTYQTKIRKKKIPVLQVKY